MSRFIPPSLEQLVIKKIRTRLLSATNYDLLNHINVSIPEQLKLHLFSNEDFLHKVVRKGDLKLTEQCLQYLPNPNPNYRMDGTNTLFHLAIASHNPNVLAFLLNKIADFEHLSTDRYGNTVYHDAACHQDAAFLSLLLKKNPFFDLSCRNLFSSSVLDFVYNNQNSQIFKAVLEHSQSFNPDQTGTKLYRKTSAFHTAVLSKNSEVLTLLLDKYPDYDPYTKDALGYTVFHVAADQNDQKCMAILLHKYPEFRLSTPTNHHKTVYGLTSGNPEVQEVIKTMMNKRLVPNRNFLAAGSQANWTDKLKTPLARLEKLKKTEEEKKAPVMTPSEKEKKGNAPTRRPK